MGIALIYFGKQGGGSHFAQAVFDSLKSDSTRLFTSDKNSDFRVGNTDSICGIPSGMIQNILLILRFGKKKKLLQGLIEKIGNDTVVFLMPHPYDFPLRKRLKNNQIFTVIHDAKRHSGDIWPTNFTIRKLGTSPGTKIFLSNHVKDSARKYTEGPSHTLPLLMGKSVGEDKSTRDIDVAILGRHKKYKNIKFQVSLVKHLAKKYRIYFSAPKNFKDIIEGFDDVVIQKNWLKTEEFQLVLLRTKTLVLTHTEASQSGLILDAIKFGACPIIPNIDGLREQANHLKIPWIYNPWEMDDVEEQINRAIAHPGLIASAREVLEEDANTWAKYFSRWME
jgi:glycosyltransferase involved in cell wall biosynthesis